MREDFFDNDQRNGVSKLYNEKGWLQFEIPYVDDLESGEGYELDSNSTIIGLLTYKAGVLVRNKVSIYETVWEGGRVYGLNFTMIEKLK